MTSGSLATSGSTSTSRWSAARPGLLVVDTHASAVAAREVIDDVRALGAGEVVAVVNTHEHFDHTFGNGAFRAAYGALPVHAHEVAAERTWRPASGSRRCTTSRTTSTTRTATRCRRPRSCPPTRRSPPRWRSTSATGMVELVHPGRGHTGGDLVVRVPDADVLLAGDLVEESSRNACPGFGGDCYPMEWPLSLDIVLGLLTSASVVVPGHGAPVDRDFVEDPAQRDRHRRRDHPRPRHPRRPRRDALDAADWPFPRDRLEHAVRRGYEHLPRSQKRLPLV